MRQDLRDRSCRLRCSLRLKARLQNWHLYFFSGAEAVLRVAVGDEAADTSVMSAAGIELGSWTGARDEDEDEGRGPWMELWSCRPSARGR